MRKLLLGVVAAVALILGAAAPASAITGNYVEDNEHPYVGLVVFYDEAGEFTSRCSGSLLTPTVFLTAGHCTDGNTSARVYFQQDAGANYDPATQVDPVTGYPETCAPGTLGVLCATSDELYNYGFDDFASFPDTHDVGIVILDQPIQLSEYGALAAPGSLDRLATARGTQSVTFTASGYGLTKSNPVSVTSFRERLMASAKLTNLRSANTDGYNLQTNGNGNGRGGTCSGDSGGPVFYGGYESNTIVAVTSFGLNSWCRGVDFSYRTDRQEVLDWIASVVGPEEFSQIRIVTI
ncbi:S1 family peptidase [Agrococcus carbonis]|uniref:Trypsin n=1 Tax=Agrococcus carbonis TaxID=684552 RepID=A0A1H1NXW5_9MICO|nr:trypsin-like serine protease [Agrococcus carbonis]SDS03784.1 Trypsin [Agrococcus carbonis]